MIASLRGTLEKTEENSILLEVGGVGYWVTLPASYQDRLPALGSSFHLYIFTQVREDAIQLFGFETWEERALFKLFLGITGIGPKVALQVMSALTPYQIKEGVQTGKVVLFTGISGVGQKTAERLIIELKGKLTEMFLSSSDTLLPTPFSQDVLHALVALGYRERDIRQAMQQIQGQKREETPSVEEMIREALQILS